MPTYSSAQAPACWYLLARGDTPTAHDLARDLCQAWLERLGADDQHTLAAATYLAWALRAMGRYEEARDLHQDTLDRERRVLGPDHPSTLIAANNLAGYLRALGRCRPPATWTKTPSTAAAGCWAPSTPAP